jgi:hypothetical protein
MTQAGAGRASFYDEDERDVTRLLQYADVERHPGERRVTTAFSSERR